MGILDSELSPYEERLRQLYPLIAESQKKEAELKAAALQSPHTTGTQAFGQALAALLPVLAGAAVGGSRGAGYGAQGGLVGLNATNDMTEKRNKEEQLSKLYLADSEKANRDLLTDESKNLGRQILTAKVSGARMEAQDKLSRDRMEVQDSMARGRIGYAASLRKGEEGADADQPAVDLVNSLYYQGSKPGEKLTKSQLQQRATAAGLADKEKMRERDRDQQARLHETQKQRAEDAVKTTFKTRAEPLRKEASAVKALESLMKMDINTTDAAIKTSLARLRGEVGAMTERDVSSNVPASIASDAISAFNYFANGTTSTITPVQREALKKYIQIKKNTIKENLQSIRTALPSEAGEANARVIGDQMDKFTGSLGSDIESMVGGGGTGSDISVLLQELSRRKNAGQ